jgi:hypothetical protein
VAPNEPVGLWALFYCPHAIGFIKEPMMADVIELPGKRRKSSKKNATQFSAEEMLRRVMLLRDIEIGALTGIGLTKEQAEYVKLAADEIGLSPLMVVSFHKLIASFIEFKISHANPDALKRGLGL